MLVANLKQPWLRLSYWWGHTDSQSRKAIGGYMLMAATTALTTPISMILIRNMLVEHVGWDSTGHWQAVWKISEVYLSVITIALGTYYLPRLSSLKCSETIISEINKTVRLVIPLVALMAFGVYLLRDIAISLLFTEEFRSARDLFSIQLFGDVIKIASWLYAYPMLSRGATKWFVCTEIVFSSMFVILSYMFVMRFGLEGMPMAYLSNYTLYLFFIYINLNKIVNS
jgi:PST family polysaccharide transporter